MTKETITQVVVGILTVIFTFFLSTSYSSMQKMETQLTAITQTTSIQGMKTQREFIAELFREQKAIEREVAVLKSKVEDLEQLVKR